MSSSEKNPHTLAAVGLFCSRDFVEIFGEAGVPMQVLMLASASHTVLIIVNHSDNVTGTNEEIRLQGGQRYHCFAEDTTV